MVSVICGVVAFADALRTPSVLVAKVSVADRLSLAHPFANIAFGFYSGFEVMGREALITVSRTRAAVLQELTGQ